MNQIEEFLIPDPQTQMPAGVCPRCQGLVYPPSCICIRCRRERS